mmetsp:Transcript_20933/g.44165  ORF Transcript_20933/g.44165 Transcript_20933/m.44165 type:complete len:702 (+) Transcript_20933:1160-3265(+)
MTHKQQVPSLQEPIMNGMVVNVTKHRTSFLPIAAMLINALTEICNPICHVHRSLHCTTFLRRGSGFLGLVSLLGLRLCLRSLRRLGNLHDNRIVTIIQVLHSQLSQHGRIRRGPHALVVLLEDREQLHKLDLVAKAHDIIDGVGRDALEGFVVLLVKAGEEEGERSGNTDRLEFLRGHLGLTFLAKAFHALVFGFNFSSVGIDQLLLSRHGAHGSLHTSGHALHLASLALPTHHGTHHHIVGQLLLLPGHGANLPPVTTFAILSLQDRADALNVSRTGSPHGRLHVIVDRALHVKLRGDYVHQHGDLHARTKLLRKLRQRLQLAQQHAGIAPLASATADDLQALLLDEAGRQVLLLEGALLFGLLLGLGAELGGLLLGLAALLGAALLVLDFLFLGDDGALEPAGAALELAGTSGVGVAVGGRGAGVAVPVGGIIGSVGVRIRIAITIAVRSLLLLLLLPRIARTTARTAPARTAATTARTIVILLLLAIAARTRTAAGIVIALANHRILPILLHNPPIRLVELFQTELHPIERPSLRRLELLEGRLVGQAPSHVILQIAQDPHQESGDAAVVLEDFFGLGHGFREAVELFHEGLVIGVLHGVAEGGYVGFEGFEGAGAGGFYHADAFFRVGITFHNPSVIPRPRGGRGGVRARGRIVRRAAGGAGIVGTGGCPELRHGFFVVARAAFFYFLALKGVFSLL